MKKNAPLLLSMLAFVCLNLTTAIAQTSKDFVATWVIDDFKIQLTPELNAILTDEQKTEMERGTAEEANKRRGMLIFTFKNDGTAIMENKEKNEKKNGKWHYEKGIMYLTNDKKETKALPVAIENGKMVITFKDDKSEENPMGDQMTMKMIFKKK
ncbi:MAG: hypothetical protein NZ551_11210 [Microscillaceae bacterium]|nr:hypothetical protein [Microscillaceae bacterium]MDW8461765.1 hypothetical protein [Cytophagales bacterium]